MDVINKQLNHSYNEFLDLRDDCSNSVVLGTVQRETRFLPPPFEAPLSLHLLAQTSVNNREHGSKIILVEGKISS